MVMVRGVPAISDIGIVCYAHLMKAREALVHEVFGQECRIYKH